MISEDSSFARPRTGEREREREGDVSEGTTKHVKGERKGGTEREMENGRCDRRRIGFGESNFGIMIENISFIYKNSIVLHTLLNVR